MTLFEHTKSSPSPSGGEDDIIELTEVVEEGSAEGTDDGITVESNEANAAGPEDTTAEAVLDIRPGGGDLEFLKSLTKPPEEEQDPLPKVPREESFDDFLASLPDLPQDLDISPETPSPQKQTAPDPRQELSERLSDEELKELVRQVIQEKVERLIQEIFPEMAAEAIERELNLWKKRLSESD